ncbi:MAG: hypothetical protein Fur006_50570 [Coleofasciculaceae cyanobacterium]
MVRTALDAGGVVVGMTEGVGKTDEAGVNVGRTIDVVGWLVMGVAKGVNAGVLGAAKGVGVLV